MYFAPRERHILHIDLDAFFVEVERILDSRLRGRPVVVGGSPNERGVVASASYEARAFGVHSAMPMGEALRLCPGVIRVDGHFDLYGRASRAVFDIVRQFSPAFEPVSIDEAYLDLTGTRRLFGAAVDASARLRREIKDRLHLDTTLGLSSNRLVAKVASDFAKPRGLFEVMPDREREFLAPLRVARLPGVGPVTERRLLDFNIRRVGELSVVEPVRLEMAFGKLGIVLHARSNGIDDTPVVPREEVRSIGHEETFRVDSNDYAFLTANLYRLVEHAAHRLREQAFQARKVQLKIRYADFVDATRDLTLPEPSDIDMELYAAAEQLLRGLYTRRTLVRLIGVRLSSLISGFGQRSLFDDDAEKEKQRAMISAIESIRRRYGYEAVQFGRVVKGLTCGPRAESFV